MCLKCWRLTFFAGSGNDPSESKTDSSGSLVRRCVSCMCLWSPFLAC